jgi:hypothetical protein
MRLVRIVLLAAIVLRMGAQTPAPGSIRGIVVKWGTNEPIADAIIALVSPSEPAAASLGGASTQAAILTTATRQNGEYVFPRVTPGRYRIVATKNGYAPGEHGRLRISGTGVPVTVASGQPLDNAKIEMAEGAAVSGRVLYANGDPMPIARVQISKLTYQNGKPEVVRQLSTYTNDLGEYRLFWVTPGSYYVSAENAQNNTTPMLRVNPVGNNVFSVTGVFSAPRPTARITREFGTDQGQTYVTSYYPGTPNWENAAIVELRPGGEASNINITMTPAVERRIRGVVFDADGKPAEGTMIVSLRQLDSSLPAALSARTLQFFPDNGRFQYVVTASGTYELTSSVGLLSARAVTTVRDRDVDVSLALLPPTNLAGRIFLDGVPGSSPGITVNLGSSRGRDSSPVRENGEFALQDVPVGTYQIELAMPNLPDAYVKSVRIMETDLPNAELLVDGFPKGELQVFVSRSGGSVEGRVLNAAQQEAANATVVVLPEGMPAYRTDRYRSASVDASGRFQFRGLPAGQYNVYAWEDVNAGAWFNPAFLTRYESFRRSFQIDDGQRATLDIVAAPVAP